MIIPEDDDMTNQRKSQQNHAFTSMNKTANYTGNNSRNYTIVFTDLTDYSVEVISL